MSNGIQALGYLQGNEPVVPASARGTARSSMDVASAAPASAPGPMTPNPSLRIDPALGIVIIEFHDQPGKVSSTIPTARQIDAYRQTSGQTVKTATPPLTATASGTETTGTGALGRVGITVASVASASPSDKMVMPTATPAIA